MSSEQGPEQEKPEESTEKANDQLSKGKGSRFAWWKNLSTPLKALLSLAGGFILAGILAVVLTSGEKDLVVDVPEAPPPAVNPNQQIPDGGSKDRVSGILVSPSSLEVAGNTGNTLPAINIRNGSARPVKVIVNYVPSAGNSLDGTPVYGISEKTINEGKKDVQMDKNTFQMESGATASVGGTIVGKPKKGIGMYGVIVLSFDDGSKDELDEPLAAGVTVNIKRLYRIAIPLTVKFPGQEKSNIEINQVKGVDDDETGLRFFARVNNKGNYLARPSGQMIISDSNGNVVSRQEISGGGIIPDNNRDLIPNGEALQGLAEGSYRATAILKQGNREVEDSWAFQIDENGRLPSPKAVFDVSATPSNIKPDEGFSVRVQARNDGTREFASVATLKLIATGTTEVLQQKKIPLSNIAPGDLTDGTTEFNGLENIGTYEIVTEITTDDGIFLGQRVGGVVVKDNVKKATLGDNIRDWMSANPLATLVVGVAIVGLLMLLGIGVYLLLQRRKK